MGARIIGIGNEWAGDDGAGVAVIRCLRKLGRPLDVAEVREPTQLIDLLTSENENYQLKLGGGLFWLDAYCTDYYSNTYLACTLER